jgi:TonB family protein
MTARSPSALMLSAAMHGLIILLLFLLAYAASINRREPNKTFELVAGTGNNYGATTAAALGTPGGIKVSIPEPLAPVPVLKPDPLPEAEKSPMTIAPEPLPKTPPMKKTPAPVATSPAAEKPPNFVNDVKRIAAKRAARLETLYHKQLEAEQARRLKAEQAAAKVQHIDAEGIKNGVTGASAENKTGGAGGKALTKEDNDLVDSYFALLKARLKENHEKPPGLSDTLVATVAFFVGADGTLSRPRIVKSSRSAEFDRSVLDAIRHTESVGPRPDHKGEEVTLDFKMRDEDAN